MSTKQIIICDGCKKEIVSEPTSIPMITSIKLDKCDLCLSCYDIVVNLHNADVLKYIRDYYNVQ